MEIVEVMEFSPEGFYTVQKLNKMLSPNSTPPTEKLFREIIASDNSHLFFIYSDDSIAGMLTVGIYKSPTGSKAWIEDVVVDEAYRGKGLGKILVQHAIDFVKSQNVELLMLTSNSARVAANKMYQSMGFTLKETNLYRMILK